MRVQWNSFYDRFEGTAKQFGTRVAIEFRRRDGLEGVTYEKLRSQAETTARFLASHSVQKGDTCAILADNDITWCAAYLGILRQGAVAVPLDTHYSPQQIATLLRDSGAKLLFTTVPFVANVEEARAIAGSTARMALLRGQHDGMDSLDDPKGASIVPLPANTITPQDRAAILYTSGTTGDPKGVVLTHGNLLAEAEAVFEAVHLDERDSILGVMPLYHALAQMANLLLPFVVGAKVIFLEEVSTPALLKALREARPTAFCCVPQFFYLIHQRVFSKGAEKGRLRSYFFRLLLRSNGALRRMAGINLGPILFAAVHDVLGRQMRVLVTGGARFDPAIGRDFYGLGFNLMEAYGLTETSGAATVTKPGDGGRGSVGGPLPGVRIRIMPEEIAGEDGVSSGEIAIDGPIVMEGYFHRPEATAETLKDGWLLTGDLGRLDQRGRLFVTGRKKEIIVLSSGKNIYPEEIEHHYAQSPFINELCVMGLVPAGEPAAERLHAVVVPDLEVMRTRKVVNLKEVLRFDIENLSVLLPAHKRILSYEIQMEALPRTTTRKLKRYEIERQAKARGRGTKQSESEARSISEEEAAWAADSDVIRALGVFREVVHGKAEVRGDSNLELDLGLDSIERVEVLANLEQLFGTTIPPEVAQSAYTVRQLVDAVRRSVAGGTAARPAVAWNKLLTELPKDEPLFQDLLQPHPVFTWTVFAILKLAKVLARILIGFRVSGSANLPKEGAYLLCPNHETYLDPFLLVSALPFRIFQKLFFVGASEYFETPFRRRAAKWMHLAPVDPDANLLRAMQAGAFGLKHGKILVLFPEGERSIDGEVKKFKKGAAILSKHLGVPIVPAAFHGVFPIWPRNRGLRWSAFLPWKGTSVRLRLGPAIPAAPAPGLDCSQARADAEYNALAEELRRTVVDLRAGL